MQQKHLGLVRVELNHLNKSYVRILKELIGINRDVISFLIDVVIDHYDEIKTLNSFETTPFVERLVHVTKDHPEPEYTLFDKKFYKLPSYMRRSSIRAAIGIVQSYVSNLEKYHEKRNVEISRGRHYKKHEPRFSYTPASCPTLYKKESFSVDLDTRTVRIKAFFHNTWDWLSVSIPERDAKCLRKAKENGKPLNPKLVFKYNKFYLEFPVKYKQSGFPEVPLEEQYVLGVDLGLNHGAVCSLVGLSGTVHERFFDPFKADMDRIDHVINLIRKYSRMSGKGQSLSALYTKLHGLKENYVRQLSHWIVSRAEETGAYGIVLEHLSGFKNRAHGKHKARVQHWCKCQIRNLVRGMAFRMGIRVFMVNPKGTSMYAYDGSGLLKRDDDNHARCVFSNGKTYNSDLSASYNIAARYFLRALLKSIPATEWSVLKAKVPELSMRTRWTLSTLRSVMAETKRKACAA